MIPPTSLNDGLTSAIDSAHRACCAPNNGIQQTQQEILDFLTEDKRASLRGSLTTLSDILADYKFNWDNEAYRTSRHGQVVEIQREAEQATEFYRANIERTLAKKSLLTSKRGVSAKLDKLQADLREYQTALYLYGFSTFLDVMLLENFGQEHLDSAIARLRVHAYQYQTLYTKAFDRIEQEAASSVETRAVGGLAGVSTVVGKAVGRLPVVSKSPVDEVLIGAGRHLADLRARAGGSTAAGLAERRDSLVLPFISSLASINRMNADEGAVYFDDTALYLEQPPSGR